MSALVYIFGREACRDPRFVGWLTAKYGRAPGASKKGQT